MGRGGKDRPCSPPRHQGRQGKENIKLFIFIPFAALVRKRDRAPGVKFRCRAVTAHLFFLPSAVLRALCVSNFNAEEAMGRGGKDRPCSPPRHQGRQGKENPLRSSASFAFRISTRRTHWDADGHIAKKEGPTHSAMRGFVHHTDTRGKSRRRRLGAFVSWWSDKGVPRPSRAEAGDGFPDTRPGFRCFPFPAGADENCNRG